ncbi:hypothetical protein GOC06_26220 [Sinorhizobium meliloti]|uniref:hypothetical protein n=1 Tax=Rhizobium meliloti TaxID=382 RepID=UPI00299F2CFC|nr:hypothetical protein [Sinorhizobium meliloti]MDX0196907.1 hypothetical protein [Sinorhizobium meliloti]MDX0258346.1 hypothetical protein [Sinorhizobium meliloti]MDX0269902.1 hypothetical protein [Sinorhizobium meliloti]
MKFNESNTVEVYPRDLLAEPASVRPAQLSPGFDRMAGKIAGFAWYHVALAELHFLRVPFGLATGCGRQVQ